MKAIHYAAFGPVLGLMVAALFPVFLSGYILWILVCRSKFIFTTIFNLITAIFTVCRECLFTNLPQTCLNEHNISGQKNCIVIWYSRKSASNTFQNLYFFFWLVFEHTDYAVVNFSPESNRTEKPPTSKSVYTFATANTLLGVEILGKFQNMDLVKIILSTWTFSFLLEFFNVTTLGVQY